MGEASGQPKLLGILVTFRRPQALAEMLAAVAAQTRSPERLVVVDNAPSPGAEEAVRSLAPAAEYVAAPENLGPAGGIAVGMERLLVGAEDRDWIVTLDDDDPPRSPEVFEELLAFGAEMVARDPATGGVGTSGVRFDRRRGRISRVPDHDLHGAVAVDAIAGNELPCYLASAIRRVGPMRASLFFGFEELDLGLRLRDAGYSLYAPGERWRAGRAAGGRLGLRPAPSRSLETAGWRRYYSLRNLVWILRDRGATAAAVRVSVVVGLAKPAVNLFRSPRLAVAHLAMNLRACRDAWTGRLGRTLEPLA